MKYPPKHYTYTITEEGTYKRSLSERLRREGRYIPSLFKFPYIEYSQENRQPPPHPHGVLLGLRVIQIISACNSYRKTKKEINRSSSNLTVRELAEMCEILFTYPTDVTRALLEEYHEFGVIELQGMVFSHHTDLGLYKIIPKAKLDYLQNNYIYDMAYLNLAAMTAPFPLKILDNHPYPFIKAAAFDGQDPNELSNWIWAKISNSIGIYRIIKMVNDIQKKEFSSRVKNLDGRSNYIAQVSTRGSRNKEGMFTFSDKMLFAILHQIEVIIKGMEIEHPTIVENIKTNLKIYKHIWGDI